MRDAEDIVEELNDKLRISGRPCITINWREFYEMCNRRRMKEGFLTQIQKSASGRYQLVVGLGKNVILVGQDRNFSPPEV